MRLFTALLLMMFLGGCTGDENINAVILGSVEMPVLLPIALAHSLSSNVAGSVAGAGPDDPEMVTALGPAGRPVILDAPVSLQSLDVGSDGTVTGFTPQSTALTCVPVRDAPQMVFRYNRLRHVPVAGANRPTDVSA